MKTQVGRKDFQSFKRTILSEMGETVELFDKRVKRYSRLALEGILMRSPVLTGRFKSNWLVTANHRQDREPRFVPPGTNGAIDGGALFAGLSVIRGCEPFSDIVIQNNTPYSDLLEAGRSKRSHAAMGQIEVTLASVDLLDINK